ncbi:MAG: 2Fe-2S iron-sulfur cluster-binding protein, partial [Candidatus Asgardarchaeia archaeon]
MDVEFILNGRKVEVKDVDPDETLANVLRDRLGITSVKIGCENGTCGV